MKSTRRGFTLIELLIVIAIIAIIAAVTFVALNPLQRFQDARDSTRWSDVSALLTAIKVDQIDNGGYFLGVVTSTASTSEAYMIGTCTDASTNCSTIVTSSVGHCIDLTGLVTEGYLSSIPTSPNGAYTWGAADTGYALTRNTNNSITITSCEAENSSATITLTR